MLCDLREDSAIAQCSEQGDEEAEVADAIDDEGLYACFGRRITQEVEADEQIRCEAYAFPADEHQQEVFREHKRKHEEHEEIQVGEESPVTLFVSHVSDGVDMDEEADAGDHEQHDHGELVELQSEVGMETAGPDPGSQILH